jgi:signal transduction histidine kinase
MLMVSMLLSMNFSYTPLDHDDTQVLKLVLPYFIVAVAGLYFSFHDIQAAAILPAGGVGIAMVYLTGRKAWRAVFVGSLLAYAVNYLIQVGSLSWNHALTSVLLATAATLEVLLGYRLIMHFLDEGRSLFQRAGGIFKFVGIAAAMGVAGATMGTLVILATNNIQSPVLLTWLLWALAEMVGILLLTPFILSWFQEFKFKWDRTITMETVVCLLVLVSMIIVSNIPYFSPIIWRSFPYLVVPLFLWLAFRFNLQISISGILLVALLALMFTMENVGPFVMESTHHSLLMLQIFIGVFCISTVVLTSTVKERQEATKAVEEFNERLEKTVLERTKKLHEEIQIRKTAEQKTKTTNKELRKTNAELDSFVYSVSHDLRAPITSVLGLLNLAKDEKDRETLQKYLDMISKSIAQQDLFIKDILNLSRNSRLKLNKAEINFKEMVDEIFEQLRYINHLKVSKSLDIDQQKPFYSDESRIKVVLNNLISNAIRHHNGKQPKVDIAVQIKPKYAHITVKDNGIGIEKEHLNKVFKMFYRATDTNHGSGLGLYIVKETLDKLQGTIKLKSEVNKGTEVYLQIPSL